MFRDIRSGRGVLMKKLILISIASLALSAFATAQTQNRTNIPANYAPTEVQGNGVKTRSGLRYWDITVGSGAEATRGSKVRVHYTGWLLDGTKFESSVDRGRPFDFKLGSDPVIPGWEEGVAGMKVGGKRQLRVPPHLGYGARRMGKIPADSTLIFDIELLAVK
jgi:peptidylprolyl isomerase